MPTFIDKNNISLLQNNTNQSFYCKYLYVQATLYLIQINTKRKIFGFQNKRFILS